MDSNLCAIASLTTDLKVIGKLKDADKIRVFQAGMVALLIAGILISNIPGLTVTHMFLFYGTLRATTMLPTMLTLLKVKLTNEQQGGGWNHHFLCRRASYFRLWHCF